MQVSTSLLISTLVASLIAGLIGHFPTRWLMDYLWQKFFALPEAREQVGKREVYEAVQPFITLLGIIERMVYAGSWLLSAPEAIAIIIALKATPSLKEWSEKRMLGRAQFNIWLMGNLINIIQSVLIAEVVRVIVASYIP